MASRTSWWVFFFSLATPLNFLSNPRKVTQIPAHQLLVLLLRYCSIHENHQPQINSELGLFPPHLSYFVGQWSCQPSVLLPSRAAVRAANCTAVWPSSTQGPPGRTDWAEVRSSLHNMCCGHFPHLPFLLSSGKRGTKLPVLYLTYGYPLQPNSLQQVGKVWWCLGEKGQQTKMRTNTTGNQITIVMQKVRSMEMWKESIPQEDSGKKSWCQKVVFDTHWKFQNKFINWESLRNWVQQISSMPLSPPSDFFECSCWFSGARVWTFLDENTAAVCHSLEGPTQAQRSFRPTSLHRWCTNNPSPLPLRGNHFKLCISHHYPVFPCKMKIQCPLCHLGMMG